MTRLVCVALLLTATSFALSQQDEAPPTPAPAATAVPLMDNHMVSPSGRHVVVRRPAGHLNFVDLATCQHALLKPPSVQAKEGGAAAGPGTLTNMLQDIVAMGNQPDAKPTWSPTGDRVACRMDNFLCVYEFPSMRMVQAVKIPSRVNGDVGYTVATWSPDGTRLAFGQGGYSFDQFKGAPVWTVVDVASGQSVEIGYAHAHWSPDGQWIATWIVPTNPTAGAMGVPAQPQIGAIRGTQGPPGMPALGEELQLAILPATGGKPWLFDSIKFQDSAFVERFQWLPNSAGVVLCAPNPKWYASPNCTEPFRHIVVAGVDGSRRKLFDGHVEVGAGLISPDGQWLAYNAASPHDLSNVYPTERPCLAKVMNLSTGAAWGVDGYVGGFSPDSRMVSLNRAFTDGQKHWEWVRGVAAVDGSGYIPLNAPTPPLQWVEWSPDSQWYAAESGENFITVSPYQPGYTTWFLQVNQAMAMRNPQGAGAAPLTVKASVDRFATLSPLVMRGLGMVAGQ